MELTLFLTKEVVRTVEADLDQQICKVHISARPAKGWLAKEALFRAASEVNVHLPLVLPHRISAATFKSLTNEDGLGKTE